MSQIELLKFITCGSVDDGKSTLIGHMLYDAKLIFADQKQALLLDSKVGSNQGKIDYSLLLDGLMAEREQGITIDVAYRYFSTARRSFIVADTPGHEEYTRNMAVGASFAQLAVILVDATKGVLEQTRRHVRICSLMGISDFVFAINKMDLVSYQKQTYEKICDDIDILLGEFYTSSVQKIPVSATEGDNVTFPSGNMDWYDGETLLAYLEQVEIKEHTDNRFYMPVQRVCRPDHSFRGFQGQIASGTVRTGDRISVLPSGETAGVRRLLCLDQEVLELSGGMPATIVLDREVDVSRGCILADGEIGSKSNLFVAQLLWMDDEELAAGQEYDLQLATEHAVAVVDEISYKIDINNGAHMQAERLKKNEIASCRIHLQTTIILDSFDRYPRLGRFVLIDRITNQTVACGVITNPMRRSENVVWQELEVTREIRAKSLAQQPKTLWFTGLSGAGKSVIANIVEKKLAAAGRHTMLLDGDNIRIGLNQDLGFSERDRRENIRRIAEVAKLLNDAGLIVLVSFISPYHSDRARAKQIIGDSFFEIYVSTPLEECARRDVKGLYKKALEGKIADFTGVSSPYEIPRHPDITIDTTDADAEALADRIIEKIFE